MNAKFKKGDKVKLKKESQHYNRGVSQLNDYVGVIDSASNTYVIVAWVCENNKPRRNIYYTGDILLYSAYISNTLKKK